MAAYSVNPNAKDVERLYTERLAPAAARRLRSSWHFLFRRVILELMPVDSLAGHFHPVLGNS